jgi:hypothetical protein
MQAFFLQPTEKRSTFIQKENSKHTSNSSNTSSETYCQKHKQQEK